MLDRIYTKFGIQIKFLEEASHYKVIINIKEWVVTKYQIHPAWTDAKVHARIADEKESALLELPIGSPVLVVHGITSSCPLLYV